jgi:Dyp-type peroxidase family
MSAEPTVTLELDDIQAAVLHPRPTPYAGAYIVLRIDDRRDGREFLRRMLPLIPSAADAPASNEQVGADIALSFQGLKALGVPAATLASFPREFQQGMAARAAILEDTGESAPEHWEPPLGTPDVHLVVTALAPDAARLQTVLDGAREAMRELPGVTVIWRQDVYMLENEHTSFGFKDGISQPAIEGSGIPGANPHEVPLKPGEFVLGYPDETGDLPPMPQPEVFGRNGTYAVFRKLQTHVAAFRQYLHARARSRAEEELLAAKIVGRWPSGAPLAFAPERDDPELGADPQRSNAFLYAADDARGLKCPMGAHARRTNPRDSNIIGVARRHRMLRRATSYGPMLPQGVLEDDGADRGIMFAFIGAFLDRQFEFVKTQWINDGTFFGGAPGEADPLVGPRNGTGDFTIPQQPIRRRLTDLPRFVTVRGGEYYFMPGLRALRWLADLNS